MDWMCAQRMKMFRWRQGRRNFFSPAPMAPGISPPGAWRLLAATAPGIYGFSKGLCPASPVSNIRLETRAKRKPSPEFLKAGF